FRPLLWGCTGEGGEGFGSPDVGSAWISPPLVGEYRRSRGGCPCSRRGAAWISPPLVGEYRRSRGGGPFSRRGAAWISPPLVGERRRRLLVGPSSHRGDGRAPRPAARRDRSLL